MRRLIPPVLLLASISVGAEDLPDLMLGLNGGQCANGPGSEGADSWFVGGFGLAGGSITGTERWVLRTNPKWAAKGGKDCEVVWRVGGTRTTNTGACRDCDFGLSFHAEPDLGASTCPEELLIGRVLPDGRRAGGEAVPFDQTYAVKVNGQQAAVYFAKSGKQLGEGYLMGEQLGYVSPHQCKWF